MRVIGFRASPSEVNYAVMDGTKELFTILSVEQLCIPLSLRFPEQLNFIRKTVKDLIFEYKIVRAGIRITESTAQNLNIERISIEAILQEVLSSSSIEKYFVGQIGNTFSKLDIAKTDFKKLVDEKKSNYKNLDLSSYNSKKREAVLIAIATFNI